MITLDAFFYIMVALFAIIGALRGFKKELLVTAAGVMGVFTVKIVVPMVVKDLSATQLFWTSLGVMGAFCNSCLSNAFFSAFCRNRSL